MQSSCRKAACASSHTDWIIMLSWDTSRTFRPMGDGMGMLCLNQLADFTDQS